MNNKPWQRQHFTAERFYAFHKLLLSPQSLVGNAFTTSALTA